MTEFDAAASDKETDLIYHVGDKTLGEEAANDIAKHQSHKTKLHELYLYNNHFKIIGMIKIAKSIQNISTLRVFSIGCNNVGEGAADDIANALLCNTKLNQLHLHNNNFKTVGVIKIVKALQNISTLTIFSIGNNNIDEEAANDIASVLSYNRKLKELYLHNNNFKTRGIIKIANC